MEPRSISEFVENVQRYMYGAAPKSDLAKLKQGLIQFSAASQQEEAQVAAAVDLKMKNQLFADNLLAELPQPTRNPRQGWSILTYAFHAAKELGISMSQKPQAPARDAGLKPAAYSV